MAKENNKEANVEETKAKNNGEGSVDEGLGLHARRIIAYIVLAFVSVMCIFWFYVLFVNATRTHAEIPLLRPILIYVMITSLIGGLQMFDVPQILTGGTGEPVESTMTLIMYLNKHLYSKNYGMGGALSVILFIITGILSLIVFKASNERKEAK